MHYYPTSASLRRLRGERGTSTTLVATAASKVLFLPELIEQILAMLPIKNLFGARRVCSTWHECINVSPQLRTACFLSGGEPSGLTNPQVAVINPLIFDLIHEIHKRPLKRELPSAWARREASWRSKQIFSPRLAPGPRHFSFGIFHDYDSYRGKCTTAPLVAPTLGEMYDGYKERVFKQSPFSYYGKIKHVTFDVGDGIERLSTE